MNTLAHLAALLALFWLSIYCFDTLAETELGVAVLCAAFLFIPLTILAAWDDWGIIAGRGK